jgi:hypothetical protein
MTTEREQWLAGLKVGDEVVVRNYRTGGDYLRSVAAANKTTVALDNGTEFRREDGEKTPRDQWTNPDLIQPTPELRAKIALSDLRNRTIRRLDAAANANIPAKWPAAKCEAVIAALDLPDEATP